MKSAVILKTIPFLALGVLLLIKYQSGRQGTSLAHPTTSLQELSGTITKVLADRDHTYVRVGSESQNEWIGVPLGFAGMPGQKAKFKVVYELEAFESKDLNMAFEKIYFGNLDTANEGVISES